MKKRISEIGEIQVALAAISIIENDKLTYAIKKLVANISKALSPLITELNEKMADAEATHAATSDKGIILTDENGKYQFTIKGAKDLAKEKKKLLDEYNSKEIEFETFLSPPCARIAELDLYTFEILTDIVIDPAQLIAEEVKTL